MPAADLGFGWATGWRTRTRGGEEGRAGVVIDRSGKAVARGPQEDEPESDRDRGDGALSFLCGRRASNDSGTVSCSHCSSSSEGGWGVDMHLLNGLCGDMSRGDARKDGGMGICSGCLDEVWRSEMDRPMSCFSRRLRLRVESERLAFEDAADDTRD